MPTPVPESFGLKNYAMLLYFSFKLGNGGLDWVDPHGLANSSCWGKHPNTIHVSEDTNFDETSKSPDVRAFWQRANHTSFETSIP